MEYRAITQLTCKEGFLILTQAQRTTLYTIARPGDIFDPPRTDGIHFTPLGPPLASAYMYYVVVPGYKIYCSFY